MRQLSGTSSLMEGRGADCWGGLAQVLSPALRRRLVLFSDAEMPVWVAAGTEDERREVVRFLHGQGQSRTGRLVEIEADELGGGLGENAGKNPGENPLEWLALLKLLRGGTDVSAVCIHDADRLSSAAQKLLMGALDVLESCDSRLGAPPRLIATSSMSPADVDGADQETARHLLMHLDVLHFELPDPLEPLPPAVGYSPTLAPPTGAPSLRTSSPSQRALPTTPTGGTIPHPCSR